MTRAELVIARKAYNTLNAAVRSGRIVRPSRCPGCGTSKRYRRIEAHHRDHANPLDVEWACSKCHGKLRERLINWGDLPPDVRLEVQAKAKHEKVSIRALILTLLDKWLKEKD